MWPSWFLGSNRLQSGSLKFPMPIESTGLDLLSFAAGLKLGNVCFWSITGPAAWGEAVGREMWDLAVGFVVTS